MKKILFYGMAFVAYMLVSKKLKDKDSELSKSFKKCTEKLTCMLNKMTESSDCKKNDQEDLNAEGKKEAHSF